MNSSNTIYNNDDKSNNNKQSPKKDHHSPKRNPAILTALDDVHRSIILNNLKFEGNNDTHPAMDSNTNKDNLSTSMNRTDNEVVTNNITLNTRCPKNSNRINIPTTKPYRHRSIHERDQQHQHQQQKNINTNNNHLKTDKNNLKKLQHKRYKSHLINQNEFNEMDMREAENIRNTECEKLNKKCKNGFCYCYSSSNSSNGDRMVSNRKSNIGGAHHIIAQRESNEPDSKKSHNKMDKVKHKDKFKWVSSDLCNTRINIKISANQVPLNITLNESSAAATADSSGSQDDSISLNNSLRNISLCDSSSFLSDQCTISNSIKESSITSTSTNEFYDCNQSNILSFNSHSSERSTTKNFSSVTLGSSASSSSSSTSTYEDTHRDLSLNRSSKRSISYSNESSSMFESIKSGNNDDSDYDDDPNDKPLIHIIQELTKQCTITSNVIINRDKLKDMRKSEKDTPIFRNKIIDDNFSNDIFDKTINMYDENNYVINNSVKCGELKANGPKYSGQQMGKLMEKRMKKIEHLQKKNKEQMEKCNKRIAPKKPPRTFASSLSSKHSGTGTDSSNLTTTTVPIQNENESHKNYIGWKNAASPEHIRTPTAPPILQGILTPSKIKPTCPTIDELNASHIGWTQSNDKFVGWTFLNQQQQERIYNMLNYEQSFHGGANFKSTNTKPQPQQQHQQLPSSQFHHSNKYDICGIKEDIDTVDSNGIITRQNGCFQNSTPKREKHIRNSLPSKSKHTPSNAMIENYTAEQIIPNDVCRKCNKEMKAKSSTARRTFPIKCFNCKEAIVKHTKSFFEKIPFEKISHKHHKVFGINTNRFSDSYANYETPQKKSDITSLENKEEYDIEKRITKRVNKSLNFTPPSQQQLIINNSNISTTPKLLNQSQTSDIPSVLENRKQVQQPPKKPLRKLQKTINVQSPPEEEPQQQQQQQQHDGSDENQTEEFNFKRVVNSPKKNNNHNQLTPIRERLNNLKYVPKKLFQKFNESSNSNAHCSGLMGIKNNKNNISESYKSFMMVDDGDGDVDIGVTALMGEYLCKIGDMIENDGKPERDEPERKLSWTSDDDYEQKLITKSLCEIDFNKVPKSPEPIYTEITHSLDVLPKTIIDVQQAPPPPPQPNSTLDHYLADNDPNAIYTQINKKSTNNQTSLQNSTNKSIPRNTLEHNTQFNTSIPSLNNNSNDSMNLIKDLTQSIDNILYQNNRHLFNVNHSNNNFIPTVNKSIEIDTNIIQDHSNKENVHKNLMCDQNMDFKSSTETFSSERMSGDSINNNIVHTITRLESINVQPYEYDYFPKANVNEFNDIDGNSEITDNNHTVDCKNGNDVEYLMSTITEEGTLSSEYKRVDFDYPDMLNTNQMTTIPNDNGYDDISGYDTIDFAINKTPPRKSSSIDADNDILNDKLESTDSEIDDEDDNDNAAAATTTTTTTSTTTTTEGNVDDTNIVLKNGNHKRNESNGNSLNGNVQSSTINKLLTPSKQLQLKTILRNSFRKTKKYFKSLDRRPQSTLVNENNNVDYEDDYGNGNDNRIDDVGDDDDYNLYTIIRNNKLSSTPRSNRNTDTDTDFKEYYKSLQSRINNATSMQELSDQYLLKLVNQIEYQQTIRTQLKNAAEICRTTKEFQCSTELIEAERLILLSHIKEHAAKMELYKIDYIHKGLVVNPIKCTGTISINALEFNMKEIVLFDTHFNYFYVCICTYREQVKSTVVRERSPQSNHLVFNCNIHFTDLSPNFEIKINVFVLRLRKTVRNYSHESKFHLNKDLPKSIMLLRCPPTPPKLSPGKMFSLSSQSSSASSSTTSISLTSNTKYNRHTNNDTNSKFRLQGETTLTSFSLTSYQYNTNEQNTHNINGEISASSNQNENQRDKVKFECINSNSFVYKRENTKAFSLTLHSSRDGDIIGATAAAAAADNNIIGPILISYKCDVHFENINVNGFLNVAMVDPTKMGAKIWNRRWCTLNGFTLNFWNYPSSQTEEMSPPILSINLTKCICDRITVADHQMCAKPRTFFIEIFNGFNYYRNGETKNELQSINNNNNNNNRLHIKTYFLVADNQKDFDMWLIELNKIIKFLRDWNI